MTRLKLIIVCLLATLGLEAQDSLATKSLFKKRDFGAYFYSDRYAPMTSLGLGYMEVQDAYNIGSERTGNVLVAEPILGVQLPVYFYKDRDKRWSLSVPISFSVWFDFTESRTAPVLNTDYRFALLEFNYSRTLHHSVLNNIGVRFIPIFHESTHVGDELLLSKIRNGIPFSRLNVSYETFELSLMLNDPYNQKIKNHSARLGAKFLWNPKKGYYVADSLEVNRAIRIQASKRWIEPSLQYQYQNPNAWLSNKRMMFIFSQDFSLRVRYAYRYYFKDELGMMSYDEPGEAYQLCSTTMLGWKLYKSTGELSNTSVFIKFYWGLNPHGQFRNMPNYPWLGVNLMYDI